MPLPTCMVLSCENLTRIVVLVTIRLNTYRASCTTERFYKPPVLAEIIGRASDQSSIGLCNVYRVVIMRSTLHNRNVNVCFISMV